MNARISTMVVSTALLATLAGTSQADVFTVGTTFSAQTEDRWCGPATAQMIFSTRELGNPPSQLDLAKRVRASNSAWNAYTTSDTQLSTDPNGLAGALNHFDAGAMYRGNSHAGLNAANGRLVNDIRSSGISAGALIGDGAHWINVRGYKTSDNGLGGETIDGFYVRDPWDNRNGVAGLGRNAYLRNVAGGWQKYFTPSDAKWDGDWDNQYVSVTALTLDAGSWTAPDRGPIQVAQLTGPQAAAAAQSYLMSNLGDFNGIGAFSSQGSFVSSSTLLTWSGDSPSTADYLVPYYLPGDVLSGFALVDSWTGDIEQISWLDSFGSVTFGDAVGYYSDLYTNGFPATAVPTPGGALLGLAGLCLMARRRRR